MQGAENHPRSQRGVYRLFKRAEQAVCKKGIERDLLQEKKCQVSAEALHADQVSRQTVKHAEKQPRDANQDGADPKKPQGTFRCRPQIICPPADRLWRVVAHEKTDQHPRDHNGPGPGLAGLKLPDVPGHKSGERQSFDEARPPLEVPGHADCPNAVFRGSSISSSRLSNHFSISSSMPSRRPRNWFNSKSGKPLLVMRAGSSSRRRRAGISPRTAISS